VDGVGAEGAFPEAYQADATVEDVVHVDRGLATGQGGAHERAQQQAAEFVHQRGGDLRSGGVGQVVVPGPETFQDVVFDLAHRPVPECGDGEQLGQVQERGDAREGAEGQQSGAEQVVGAGPQLEE
jgi:hypothetical protein